MFFKDWSVQRTRNGINNDVTIQRTKEYTERSLRALPAATVDYLLDKVPIVSWLPKYRPRWIINDVVAGVTVGVLLIPQALAYATIATIPGQYGLMSSWLPNFIYFIMGTSKDISTGPTTILGLLTADIIKDLSSQGYEPQAISGAVAMMVGIYSLVFGLFNLGFLLEFVSLPVLNGFFSAVAINIMLGQIPKLFDIDTGDGTAATIHDFFANIATTSPQTVAIGFSSIILLILLQKMGQRWGKKSKIIWLIATARGAIVLGLFLGISYGVNKDIDLENDDPIFPISKVKASGIVTPRMPDTALIKQMPSRAIAPFLAAVLEHLAIAKVFGRKNDYVISESQELNYLGVTNFFNSFFSSMPVGGAMSRTAVNSDAGVKSPTYGLVSGAFIILAIYKLTGALFWIPKATLAAIIIIAVWHLFGPISIFVGYWRTSLTDFIGSMLAFWITLFVSAELGIEIAVAFSVAVVLLRAVFARVHRVKEVSPQYLPSPVSSPTMAGFNRTPTLDTIWSEKTVTVTPVPSDTVVFKYTQPVIFPNAYLLKRKCFDTIKTYTSGSTAALADQDANRNWSVIGARKLKQLRAKAGVTSDPTSLRLVVIDLSGVPYIDTTGVMSFKDLKTDVRKYGGDDAEIRFVGMTAAVKERFQRYGWKLVEVSAEEAKNPTALKGMANADGEKVFESLSDAVYEGRKYSTDERRGESDIYVSDEKV